MSRKHFSILLVLAVTATVAVLLLVPGQTGRDPGAGEALLLPGAAGWINDVSRVTVQHGEDQVTLERSGDAWQVAELQGYPADWSRLRGVLGSLAEARVIERKTDNPDYYDRLGVEDPSGENSGGVLLRLEHGAESKALVVGKTASSGTGQYVRWLHEAGSALIDQALDVPRTAVDWARREIIDIPSSDVAEVEIIHPDGDWIRAEKEDAGDTDFLLSSLPEGREVASSWSVNSLGGALSALRMDDVQPAGAIDEASAIRFRLLTFGGIEYTARAWEDADDRWIHVQAATVGAETEEASAASANDGAETRVDAFNRQVAGWHFRVPGYKFDALTRRSESLLQPLEEDSESGDP